MAKYQIKKPCFFNDRLYPEGEIVDFGDVTPPKGSVEIPNLVEKAKAAVASKASDVEKEDALLKNAAAKAAEEAAAKAAEEAAAKAAEEAAAKAAVPKGTAK